MGLSLSLLSANEVICYYERYDDIQEFWWQHEQQNRGQIDDDHFLNKNRQLSF